MVIRCPTSERSFNTHYKTIKQFFIAGSRVSVVYEVCMSTEQQKPLSLPVLVDCMPDNPQVAGEVTWFHPDVRGSWAVRLFSRSDIDRLAGELSAGQRERFLSMLGLLQGIARQDQSKIGHARERLDRAGSLIREENAKVANSLLTLAGQSVHVRVGEEEAVLEFEPSALSDFAASLKQGGPPISPQADSRRVLSSEITSELHHVKLVLWFASHRLSPALYSSTNLAAAYAFTLLGEWVGWEVCLNCGKFFRQSRPDKKWCSDRCGNAYRVRKSQEKTRSEEKKAPKTKGS